MKTCGVTSAPLRLCPGRDGAAPLCHTRKGETPSASSLFSVFFFCVGLVERANASVWVLLLLLWFKTFNILYRMILNGRSATRQNVLCAFKSPVGLPPAPPPPLSLFL